MFFQVLLSFKSHYFNRADCGIKACILLNYTIDGCVLFIVLYLWEFGAQIPLIELAEIKYLRN